MQCQKMLWILWICAIILPALLSRNCLLKKQGHKVEILPDPITLPAEEKFKEFKEQPLFALQNEFYSTDIMTVTASTAKKYWPKRAEMFRIILDDPPIFFISILWCQLKLAAPTMHFAFCWKKVFNRSGRFLYYGPLDAIKRVLCR